jgi:hypothetical protein
MEYARKCDACGSGMNVGYVIAGGEEYYCSDDCLFQKYSPEECKDIFAQEDEDGNPIDNDSYWTKWDSEDDED